MTILDTLTGTIVPDETVALSGTKLSLTPMRGSTSPVTLLVAQYLEVHRHGILSLKSCRYRRRFTARPQAFTSSDILIKDSLL
jgi:hypothetical protein